MNVYLEARPLEVLFRTVWVRDVFPLSVLVHKLIHILYANVVHDPLKSVQKSGHCAELNFECNSVRPQGKSRYEKQHTLRSQHVGKGGTSCSDWTSAQWPRWGRVTQELPNQSSYFQRNFKLLKNHSLHMRKKCWYAARLHKGYFWAECL